MASKRVGIGQAGDEEADPVEELLSNNIGHAIEAKCHGFYTQFLSTVCVNAVLAFLRQKHLAIQKTRRFFQGEATGSFEFVQGLAHPRGRLGPT